MDKRKDPGLRAALDRMGQAATAVLSEPHSVAVEEAKQPVCDAVNLMRDRGWPPERALGVCKRVCSHARMLTTDSRVASNKRAELANRRVAWLIDCYFV